MALKTPFEINWPLAESLQNLSKFSCFEILKRSKQILGKSLGPKSQLIACLIIGGPKIICKYE